MLLRKHPSKQGDMENLQPSSSHSIMAASTLYFLSLVFIQFVNIKTVLFLKSFFKDTKFSMHKLVWNRMEFPIQQKRKECFRNQNSLLPVFLLQHKYKSCAYKSAHSQEERGEPLNSALLVVRHDGENFCHSLGNLLWKVCQSSSPF